MLKGPGAAEPLSSQEPLEPQSRVEDLQWCLSAVAELLLEELTRQEWEDGFGSLVAVLNNWKPARRRAIGAAQCFDDDSVEEDEGSSDSGDDSR